MILLLNKIFLQAIFTIKVKKNFFHDSYFPENVVIALKLRVKLWNEYSLR